MKHGFTHPSLPLTVFYSLYFFVITLLDHKSGLKRKKYKMQSILSYLQYRANGPKNVLKMWRKHPKTH